MILRRFFSYAFFSIAASGVGFITSIYLAKVITPTELGAVGLFQTFIYATVPLVTFSSVGLVAINKVKLNLECFQQFANAYFTFSVMITLTLFIVSLLCISIYPRYTFLLVAIPIMSFIKIFTDFHSSELVQLFKSKLYGIFNLAESIVGLVLSVVFISIFHLTWQGRIAALVLSIVCVLVIRYFVGFKALKSFRFLLDVQEIKKILIYGAPLMVSLGAAWILNNIDRFVVLHYFSLNAVGVYTLAFSIASVINIVNAATVNAIAPAIYQKLHEKNAKKIVFRYNLYYSVFILTLALIIGISSRWYMPLFFGNKYQHIENVILWIALSFAFGGVYKTMGLVIDFFQRNKLKTILLYISAAIVPIFSILFVHIIGMIAPAVGITVGYMFLAASSYVYGWKIMREENIS